PECCGGIADVVIVKQCVERLVLLQLPHQNRFNKFSCGDRKILHPCTEFWHHPQQHGAAIIQAIVWCHSAQHRHGQQYHSFKQVGVAGEKCCACFNRHVKGTQPQGCIFFRRKMIEERPVGDANFCRDLVDCRGGPPVVQQQFCGSIMNGCGHFKS